MGDVSGAGWRVMFGSCLDRLKDLPDNSVDSVVTDPPYELGFMGKSWDSSGIAYNVDVWRECLRVLKPGGHLLAFGGSRTWHRLAVAVDDAGFEIRDSIAWIYGSGFPKSLDVSKAIDKAAGAEREVIGQGKSGKTAIWNEAGEMGNFDLTKSATPEAKRWEGWGTALKPAFEPVVVARKPLVGTVAQNVLEWGVGGLNIDGSRIGSTVESWPSSRSYAPGQMQPDHAGETQKTGPAPAGRWPANVILDEFTAGLLDEQSGVSRDGVAVKEHSAGKNIFSENSKPTTPNQGYGGQGGASRFFYVADTLKHDTMSLCKHTHANTVATLFSTIQATIENTAPTNVALKADEQLALNVKNAGIQCDSCATHIAAGLVVLKTLASNAETSQHFQACISDFGSSTLTQSLASLVEKWVSTDTIPTMTDCLTLFGCVLLATDELTKPESPESDKGRSRFIYQAKASKRDRNEGLENLEAQRHADRVTDDGVGGDNPRNRTNQAKQNFHPTVKPTQLMRYLIKLVTPPGGVVLDPFTGSGSTGKAAILEGFDFVGVELTEEYLPIIEGRLQWAFDNRDDGTLF